MTASNATKSRFSARRLQALLATALVFACGSIAAADTSSASLQVSTHVVASCDISDDRIPTASCVGIKDPMINTAPELVINANGEQVQALVTTMNF